MTVVIKRNNKRQKFSRAKIERAIKLAAREARLSAAMGKKIAREIAASVSKVISRRKSIKSTQLRTKVLRRLATRSKAAVVAWRRYDRKIRR